MFTLETVAGWLISFLAAFLTKWLADKRAEQAQRDLGAEQVRADVNKEAADAERRAAAVPDRDRDTTAANLDRGLF